eukprot:13966-Chlamydomonas_euryale.AAC.2
MAEHKHCSSAQQSDATYAASPSSSPSPPTTVTHTFFTNTHTAQSAGPRCTHCTGAAHTAAPVQCVFRAASRLSACLSVQTGCL